jgi:histidinol phosphatase-like PHP family hydrolase
MLERHQLVPQELIDYLHPRGGLEQAEKLREQLSGIDTQGMPKTSIGAEIDVYKEFIALTPEGRIQLDHTVMSANHPVPPMLECPAGDDTGEYAKFIMEKTMRAVTCGFATSIGHPFLALGHPAPVEVYRLYPDMDIQGLFEEARDRNVAFGFSRHLLTSRDILDLGTAEHIYTLAARVGVKLAFETDSHRHWHLACIHPLVALARLFSLKPEHFLDEESFLDV